MNMDNMDKCLEEVNHTGIFVCFCVSTELVCLDLIYINIRISKCDRRQHKDVVISLLMYFCATDRLVRNEDVLGFDTSFERLDVHYYSK